jgi:hypothetical protein
MWWPMFAFPCCPKNRTCNELTLFPRFAWEHSLRDALRLQVATQYFNMSYSHRQTRSVASFRYDAEAS